MTWASPQLMAWIQRIEAKAPRASLFELLELGTTADSAAITGAFHRIAGGAHPDLHRHTLSPADAERLLSAYGKIAAAYDTLRDPRTRERYRKELADRGKSVEPPPVIGGSQAVPIQRPVPAAAALAGRTGAASLGPSYGDELLGRTITPGRITQPPPRGGSPSSPPDLGRSTPAMGTSRAPTSPTPGRGTPAITTPPSSTIPPAKSRTTTPSMPAVSRTSTPTTPAVSRTATPTTPAPAVSRTTTPSTPAASRTTTPSRITASPSRITAPRTAVAPPPRAITDSRTPLITPAASGRPTTSPPSASSASASSTRPPATTTPSAFLRGRADSRPPMAGVVPRGQAYFRKAQGCLAQGDLGGALFNLRLAAAADPSSALIRVALAEVEGEMTGRK